MIQSSLATLVFACAATLFAAGEDAPREIGTELAQLTIHERIIVRVPRIGPSVLVAPVVTRWKEKRGPKCLAPGNMAGALVSMPGSIDLVMRGGRRYRAKLDGKCRQLGFYSGFYLNPASDGMICAGRDAIHIRSGASCDIKTFRTLVAKR